jgi:NAD(P)H-nitrite reductase large subunit
MEKEILSQIDRIDDLIERSTKLEDEVLICECFCVNVRDIRTTCEDIGIFDLSRVQEAFSFGQGCSGCLKKIDSWVHKIF